MSEPRYTLEEAKRKIALDECAHYGHTLEVIIVGGKDPVALSCSLCDTRWKVSPVAPDEAIPGDWITENDKTPGTFAVVPSTTFADTYEPSPTEETNR